MRVPLTKTALFDRLNVTMFAKSEMLPIRLDDLADLWRDQP